METMKYVLRAVWRNWKPYYATLAVVVALAALAFLLAGCTSGPLQATCTVLPGNSQASVVVTDTDSQGYVLSGATVVLTRQGGVVLPAVTVSFTPVTISSGGSYTFYVGLNGTDTAASNCKASSLAATVAALPPSPRHHHHGCQMGLLGVCKGKRVSL